MRSAGKVSSYSEGLKMISAQVVETSVTNNRSFQNNPHPDDHAIGTTERGLLETRRTYFRN